VISKPVVEDGHDDFAEPLGRGESASRSFWLGRASLRRGVGPCRSPPTPSHRSRNRPFGSQILSTPIEAVTPGTTTERSNPPSDGLGLPAQVSQILLLGVDSPLVEIPIVSASATVSIRSTRADSRP
jgi:hypothetical protein